MTMKKGLTLLLIAIILISLTACGNKEQSFSPDLPSSDLPVHNHNWVDANYQEAKMCLECGETEGEPIPPKFISLGFKLSEIGKTYTYKSCYEDKSNATGKVNVSEVQIIEGDDYYEPKEDYEWIIAKALIEVESNPKVFQIGIERMDYYSYDLNTIIPTNTVNYYGKDYEVVKKTKILQNTATIMEFEIGYLVPKGYDGVILVFFNDYNNMIIDYENPETKAVFDDILDGDTLFFKLKK